MTRHFRLVLGPIMSFILHPWQLFFIVFAGWVNRQQHEIIAYLRTENQVLREKLGKKRILLNDDQRRRLAVKGKVLGRKLLEDVGRAEGEIGCRERLGESAKKRSPGAILNLDAQEHADQLAASDGRSDVFEVAWAREVIAEALRRMQVRCEEAERADIWGVFECRILDPTLNGAEPSPYEQIVERFGFQSPTQASNVLTTAKRMFSRSLRSVIGEYVKHDRDIDAEISDLRKILSDGRAE